MQTIRIIIVKRKLNYLKNEITMTDYDSSLEVETSANVILKLFRQRLFRWTGKYLLHTTMFDFNADNAAARKPRDRSSASCSSILGLQYFKIGFNKLFQRSNGKQCYAILQAWPGPGKYDLCRILGEIRRERRFRHTTVSEHALYHASNWYLHCEFFPSKTIFLSSRSLSAQHDFEII